MEKLDSNGINKKKMNGHFIIAYVWIDKIFWIFYLQYVFVRFFVLPGTCKDYEPS